MPVRSMTPEEKKFYKDNFPNLDVDAAAVTGEADPIYNCLAWTLGFTDRWLWPVARGQVAKASDFDRLYGDHGYVRASDGPIAAYGASLDDMRHGTVSGPGHGPRWESKCGAGLRFQHGLVELKSEVYGDVRYFYAKKGVAAAMSASDLSSLTTLSADEVVELRKTIDAVPADFRGRFQTLYDEWAGTWKRAHILLSSDPAAVRRSDEFLRLVSLGEQALPLVVEKLFTRDSPFAMQLYEALQREGAFSMEVADSPDFLVGGEQVRAAAAGKRWLTR